MNQILSLVEPTTELRDTYASYVEEFRAKNEKMVPFVIGLPHEPFDEFVAQLRGYSEGTGLPNGLVPHSTFWLIDQNREIVAVSNMRHALTEKLKREGGHIGYSVRPTRRGEGCGIVVLREMLKRARELGLARVLMTCGQTNRPSVRVIQRNGGQFDSEEFLPERGEIVQRYWIELT